MRVTYANCRLRHADYGDVLLTDEVTVAEAAPEGVRTLLTDTLYDTDEAQALNVAILDAAFDWFRAGGEDPTVVGGVSAADLAGSEVAITLLMPVVRGWLGAAAAFAPGGPLAGETPSVVTIHAPQLAAPGARRFCALERLQCDGAAAAVRARFGDAVEIRRRDGTPTDTLIEQKFVQTRDCPWLRPETRAQHLRLAGPGGVINAAAILLGRRRAESLLVYEYNPTNAFARQYGARAGERMRLVLCRTPRDQLDQIVRHADRILIPPRVRAAAPGQAEAMSALARALDTNAGAYRERLCLHGIDLWPLIRDRLQEVVGAYQAFAAGAAAGWRARLRRQRVRAVLVPFDTPPETRLLVSIARAEGIPTFLVNDGFKADDFSMEGMTADHVLAWSDALAVNYYARRPGPSAVVTGNPKADAQRAVRPRLTRRGLQRVLVGSFTFSPVDLNCRRSDSEFFLSGVLGGIRESRLARGAVVCLKLHPADRPDHYASVLAAIPEVPVEIITEGDVVEHFDTADLYITTYSTSLLEAVARDLPVFYYRVNPQRLHPPFSGDPFLEARTASGASELAALIDDPALREPFPAEVRDAWVERYLGATDGHSTERIERAILARLQTRNSAVR